MNKLIEYFEELKITKEYKGYFYSVADAITIII